MYSIYLLTTITNLFVGDVEIVRNVLVFAPLAVKPKVMFENPTSVEIKEMVKFLQGHIFESVDNDVVFLNQIIKGEIFVVDQALLGSDIINCDIEDLIYLDRIRRLISLPVRSPDILLLLKYFTITCIHYIGTITRSHS